ncbi:MAG: Peptide methionine sulfoxide reductase MsrA [candidate division WS6 bacterium OLB20]|uniref:Peptide methionine sulfoxide reductase MsrA n=1 Tax=candidate division WS6 bacterium OLB20 TaxID=1617426 RepID=A0A136LWS0_9BACT|nr:MAG: Peptide methionine sulfoxide reductase MsrA [candidate division WS6 bacterium OLB20]
MGCFWCTEAVFKELKGVVSVIPGYSGGEVENPTYEAVCEGTTGHAEVAQIEFDPDVITYSQLLDVFWHVHDPTTPDRQGNDRGPQYRSEIFYHSDEQKQTAQGSRQKLEADQVYPDPVVTKITPFTTFL